MHMMKALCGYMYVFSERYGYNSYKL